MSLRYWLVRAFVGVGVILGLVIAVLAVLIAYPELLARDRITVVSWGDAYQQAQLVAFAHPFTDAADVDVDMAIYGGGLDDIRRQAETGEGDWDVVDLDLTDAVTACREGLLEPFDAAALPPGATGEPAADDFVMGAIGQCWVGTVVYSQVVIFAPGTMTATPQGAADFFDLESFPGARGLRDGGPEFNLPLALLADGVAPAEVYPMLRTEEGVARAFAKLDMIGESIVWWRRPNEPVEMLARGDVAMTTALNGRAFEAEIAGADIATLWDGQLYGLDVFAVPKNAPEREHALAFLAFAGGVEPLAAMASRVPYGPARLSAAALVGTDPLTGTAMLPHLPTAPDNFRNAHLLDPAWWDANRERLLQRWNAWRAE